MRTRIIACIAAVFPLVFLVSCGSSGPSAGNGTLAVRMSDAPCVNITALNVTIGRVEANVNGSWTTISTTPQTFNLLDLVQNDTLLASGNLPAGHYTQIRFFPTSASVTDATGTYAVNIPSGVQTGVKVKVDYDINSNTITTILLDFNVCKSLHQLGNGKYQLQPVIPAVVKILSGTVTGKVMRNGNPVQNASITATYTAGSNYPIGTDVNTGMSLADGSFKIWALLPGTYTITASFTDTNTSTTYGASIAGVNVSANQNTDVSTMNLQ